ncbi:unnamed protein product [Effrenium voratum]|nr:unnamed protein product [Effrenium voratum]
MQFVAFLLLATVPASLGVSSGAKAKLAFIEERMHARMKTMTPETATLTNIEKSVLNMAQTKLSKTSANADAANLTAFLDQIQELLDNTMKKNILLRKEQTQADLDAGFGNLSSCLHPNDTSFNEDLKALSASHKTCRSEQDAVWKDYDATCILAKNIYLQNIKTLCDAYATAAVFPNPITTCSMDDAVQVPTIGNFLGDMEKFFEDEYESLKEKKDKCDTARDTPFEHEELCKSKICSYYDHKISCDGKQKSLEEEACTLHKGHTCSGYSDCYTDKVEVYNGVVTLAKEMARRQ